MSMDENESCANHTSAGQRRQENEGTARGNERGGGLASVDSAIFAVDNRCSADEPFGQCARFITEVELWICGWGFGGGLSDTITRRIV